MRNGAALLRGEPRPHADFFTGDPAQRDGVRVAVKDLDGDDQADVVVGGTGRVAGYTGKSLLAAATPTTGFAFDIVLDTPGDAFVGRTRLLRPPAFRPFAGPRGRPLLPPAPRPTDFPRFRPNRRGEWKCVNRRDYK